MKCYLNKPERPPCAMQGIGHFQNLRNILRNCLDFFLISWEFLRGLFWRNFCREISGRSFQGGFFRRIFWEDFLGRIFWEDFLGGFFWEDFFGRNFFGRNSLEIDLFVKILVFVKILYLRKGRQVGRQEGKFKSLEVRLQVHRT